MAQHDMVIDNGPGLAVRTDMNAAILALVENSSGPIEPVVMYPGMFWLNTSYAPNGRLVQRDLANANWIAVQSMSGQTAADLPFVPSGSITSNNVQAAIQELDADIAVIGQGDIGRIVGFPRRTPPIGWLKANGANLSRATYFALFDFLCPIVADVTLTIATPAVAATVAPHGLQVGSAVSFDTAGTLPTGVVAGTTYYIISAGFTANQFRFSATLGGAAINTTGAQSGIHKLRDCPFGCDAINFKLPDMRGIFSRWFDDGAGRDVARVFGQLQADDFKSHTHTADAVAAHAHSITTSQPYTSGTPALGNTGTALGGLESTSGSKLSFNAGGHTPSINAFGGVETRPANQALLACIKY